jgi:hypothetical protein
MAKLVDALFDFWNDDEGWFGIRIGLGEKRSGPLSAYFTSSGVAPQLVLDYENQIYSNDGTSITDFASVHTVGTTGPTTVVDSDGKLKWAPHNIVVAPKDLSDAAYTKKNCTISTDAAVAPDGTTTADKIIEASDVGQAHHVRQNVTTVTGVQYSRGVFLKAAERTAARVLFYQSSSPFTAIGTVTVDLTDGSILSGSGTIVSHGNGWYEIFPDAGNALTTTTTFRIDTAIGTSTAYNGDGSSGIYVWFNAFYRSDLGGMQDNDGTFSKFNDGGSSAYYAPGIDHDPNTNAPIGIWAGEARTNLEPDSNDFTAWTNTYNGGVTLTASQATGPDGNTSLHKLARVDANNDGMDDTLSPSASTTYTFSAFWTAGTAAQSSMLVYDDNAAATLAEIKFDWSAGVPSTASSTGASNIVYDDWGSGLYRISFNFTTAGVVTTHKFILLPETNGSGTEYAYAGFTQIEANSKVSPYTPTSGGTVTRPKMLLSLLTSSFSFSATEGAIVIKYHIPTVEDTSSPRLWSLDDGTVNETIRTYTIPSSMKNAGVIVDGGSSVGFVRPTNTMSYDADTKFSFGWKLNDLAASLNGGTEATDTSSTIATVTTLNIGTSYNQGEYLNGWIKHIVYYSDRLAA